MDGESNDDGSYIDVLLEPHVNERYIPESDDFPDLADESRRDVGRCCECDEDRFAKEEPVREKELNKALRAHTSSSFGEFVSHADVLAADHGIYVVRNEFANTVDVNTFKTSTEASDRMNVGEGA